MPTIQLPLPLIYIEARTVKARRLPKLLRVVMDWSRQIVLGLSYRLSEVYAWKVLRGRIARIGTIGGMYP